jgi:hypothetical protein
MVSRKKGGIASFHVDLSLQILFSVAYFKDFSSEVVSLVRPLARRAANTRRPFADDILKRKPCLLVLFLCEGWNVLFIA